MVFSEVFLSRLLTQGQLISKAITYYYHYYYQYHYHSHSHSHYRVYNKILDICLVLSAPIYRVIGVRSRAITWVSNYRCLICRVIGVRSRGCPITAVRFELFYNWIPVIGHPRDSHVNYSCLNGFLRTVSYSF